MNERIEMAWYSETIRKNEKMSSLYDELDKLTTQQLLTEFDKTMDGEIIKDRPRYEVIQGLISDRLHLTSREIIQELLWDEFSCIHKRLDELEAQFKNHRHNLEKTYSEKPVW